MRFKSSSQRKAVMAKLKTAKRVKHGVVLVRDDWQTGKTSIKHDKRIKALPPGKRIAPSGYVYYEHRRNRSDKNQKKKL